MVIVIVQHFLNSEGQDFFPKWVKKTATILNDFEGFISMEVAEKVDAQGTFLLLKFDNLENLRCWSRSEEHTQALAELSHYRMKKQQSQLYQVGKQ